MTDFTGRWVGAMMKRFAPRELAATGRSTCGSDAVRCGSFVKADEEGSIEGHGTIAQSHSRE